MLSTTVLVALSCACAQGYTGARQGAAALNQQLLNNFYDYGTLHFNHKRRLGQRRQKPDLREAFNVEQREGGGFGFTEDLSWMRLNRRKREDHRQVFVEQEHTNRYLSTPKVRLLGNKNLWRRAGDPLVIQEETRDGVVLASAGGRVPLLRLPAARRQYMEGSGLVSAEEDSAPVPFQGLTQPEKKEIT